MLYDHFQNRTLIKKVLFTSQTTKSQQIKKMKLCKKKYHNFMTHKIADILKDHHHYRARLN